MLCDVYVAQGLCVNTNHNDHKRQLISDGIFINMPQVKGERKVQAVQFWCGSDTTESCLDMGGLFVLTVGSSAVLLEGRHFHMNLM